MSIVKLSNNGVKNATALGSISSLGSMIFIKKLTASSDSTLSFVDGTSDVVLDDTYKEYLFTFNNMHPATDNVRFTVNFRDGGSSYDATKTTTNFSAYHNEAGGTQAVGYNASHDLAQSTSDLNLSAGLGNDNDQSLSGYLHLFNPSSTTFAKHFMSNTNTSERSDFTENMYVAGYCNVTVAIDGVQFKMSSGNIDLGDICLYGIA
jgi:hypothetical protein